MKFSIRLKGQKHTYWIMKEMTKTMISSNVDGKWNKFKDREELDFSCPEL